MFNMVNLSANADEFSSSLFPFTSSVAKRLVNIKWPDGVTESFAGSLLDELMLFNLWTIKKEFYKDDLHKQEKILFISYLKDYILSEKAKDLTKSRNELFNYYSNNEIISKVGESDPLTATVIFLIEYLRENSIHYTGNFIDGRDIIPIMSQNSNESLIIAAFFKILSRMSNEIADHNLIDIDPINFNEKFDKIVGDSIREVNKLF